MNGPMTAYRARAAVLAALALALPPPPGALAAERRTPVVESVEQVSPAVVNINTSIREAVNPFRGRSPLSEYFGGAMPPALKERESLGSGVIIRPEGYILTNNHVIDGASEIRVTLADEREYPAEVVGVDARNDVAVIKVEADAPLPSARMGKSDDLMIGETVIAIGNPFGLSHTVTTGVISAVGRNIKTDSGRMFVDFIQLDASINPGNSGGPLLNVNGEVIGITTAIYASAEGIGFAIPIDRARRIMDDLIAYGKVTRGYTGFFVDDLDPALRQKLGWKEKGGVLVTKVLGGGPAQRAGLRPGDIIHSVNGRKTMGARSFDQRMASFTSHDKIELGVFTDSDKKTVTLTPAKIDPATANRIASLWLGVEVAPLTEPEAKRLRLATTRGMVITKVDPYSELAEVGVEAGDVIRKINNITTDGMDGFMDAMLEGQYSASALVYIQRGSYVYKITVGG